MINLTPKYDFGEKCPILFGIYYNNVYLNQKAFLKPKWESNRGFFQFVINLTPKYDFGEKCPILFGIYYNNVYLNQKAFFKTKMGIKPGIFSICDQFDPQI